MPTLRSSLEFMKTKILIPLCIIGALGAFFAFRPSPKETAAASDERRKLVLTTVMNALKEGHYSPRPLDDSFSARIWDNAVSALDYQKNLFTQGEINTLQTDRYSIDDQLKAGSSEFFTKLDAAFEKGVDRAQTYSDEILKTPFTFTAADSVQLNGDKIGYAADDVALKQRWQKFLKYRVLSKYVELKDAQAKDSTGAKKKTDAQLEEEARTATGKNQSLYFRRLKKMDENQRFTLYVNAITGAEDPHTDYFPPKEKQRFDEAMSGSFSGIGAQLSPEDGKITVSAIIPGSPSWKQGQLKAGDEIQKVAQGAAEPEDVQGWDLEDVVSKIRGKKGSEVRLTVKRADGSQKVIPIIRGDVLMEETFAKSAIIQGKKGSIGYITLPEFYADFTRNTGRHSSADVAIEIQKLKNSGVKGIILDLRNNGGGSLGDVVDMAGLFIDQGPIVQVKSSDAPPMTLRDSEKGSLFDGPLVIMVNSASASASEIMAAAMQDYKRAIIVGSNTFGKGTVQKVISLDETVSPLKRIEMMASAGEGGVISPIGSLKLTMQKFYRVSGASTQRKGVVPDVVLPDAYEYLEDMGERKNKAALPYDVIAPSAYQPVGSVSDMAGIIAKSKARVAANGGFRLIKTNAQMLKAREEGKAYPLSETGYRRDLAEANAASKKLEELEKSASPLVITNLRDDEASIQRDTTTVAKNATWIKNLKKDLYLGETVNIINDMMATEPSKVTMREPK